MVALLLELVVGWIVVSVPEVEFEGEGLVVGTTVDEDVEPM